MAFWFAAWAIIRGMHHPNHRFAVAVVVALVVAGAMRGSGQVAPPPAAAVPVFKADPPRFTDSARTRKLSNAFPDIDRLMQEFVTREHIPGATWGPMRIVSSVVTVMVFLQAWGVVKCLDDI